MMPRTKRKLSEKEVRALRNVPGTHATGDNIYLHVEPTKRGKPGAASWRLRFMLGGTATTMGLGKWRDAGSLRGLGLAEVRETASEHLKLLDKGINPIEHRSKEREAERARKLTNINFRDATEQFLEIHE